jgi:hypothetical protein
MLPWMRANVEFIATKKGMAAALAVAAHGSSDLVTYSLDRLTRAVGDLLQRAVAVGEIRADISPEDLLRGDCRTSGGSGAGGASSVSVDGLGMGEWSGS